jgi:hypothetical protein
MIYLYVLIGIVIFSLILLLWSFIIYKIIKVNKEQIFNSEVELESLLNQTNRYLNEINFLLNEEVVKTSVSLKSHPSINDMREFSLMLSNDYNNFKYFLEENSSIKISDEVINYRKKALFYLENIEAAINIYNNYAASFNSHIRSFPYNIIAKLTKVDLVEYF